MASNSANIKDNGDNLYLSSKLKTRGIHFFHRLLVSLTNKGQKKIPKKIARGRHRCPYFFQPGHRCRQEQLGVNPSQPISSTTIVYFMSIEM